MDPSPPLAAFPGSVLAEALGAVRLLLASDAVGLDRHRSARRLRAVVAMSGACPVVMVTGASGGVGRGIAVACGQAGWTVWIAARREAEAAAVAAEVDAAGGHGRAVMCDAADPASVQAAVDTVIARDGRLDGVVHNATSGLSPHLTDLADVPLVDVGDHVAVSLRGTYLLAPWRGPTSPPSPAPTSC